MLNVFNVLIVVVVVVVVVAPVCSRIMDRCTLAQEMANLGVSFVDLAKWTCIAKHESAYRTDIVGGSDNYGLFQINTHWCKPSNGRYSRNVCSLNCSDLLTDDIAGSVQCAQKIFNIRGWQAWSASAYCSSQLSSIEECFVK